MKSQFIQDVEAFAKEMAVRLPKAWVLRSNRNGITYKTQLITQYKLLIFSCVFAFYKQDVFHIRF